MTQDEEQTVDFGGRLSDPTVETVAWPPMEPYQHVEQKFGNSLAHPFGTELLTAIDDEFHEERGALPAFEVSVDGDFLHDGIGPLTAIAEDLYLVVTDTALAVTTKFDGDRFGMVYSHWDRRWTLETPGVVEVDAADLWEAITAVTDVDKSVSLWMDGSEALHVVPIEAGTGLGFRVWQTEDPIATRKEKTRNSELCHEPIEISGPLAAPSDVPEQGGVARLLTGTEDDSRKISGWNGTPTTRLLVGDPKWIGEWLSESDSRQIRLRAGLVNEEGTPGDGVVALSNPEGEKLTSRTGLSLRASDASRLTTSPLGGVVWPTGEESGPAEAFDPETSSIPPGSVGVVADVQYDAGQLQQFFNGFDQEQCPGMWVTIGSDGKLRFDADVGENRYLLYEQVPVESDLPG